MRDDSGAATAIWFNQGFLARTLQKGQTLQLRATVRAGRGLELAVREHEVLAEAGEGLHTSGVVAVYDASRTLSTRVIRELVEQHLPRTDAIADPLPGRACASPGGCRCGATRSRRCTRRATPDDTRIAGDRLAYEELLLLQVALAERRAVAPAGRAARTARRAARALPRVAAVHAHDAARSAACATSTATSRATARCGACCWATSARARRSSPCTRCCARPSAAARRALLAPTEVLVQQHAATVRALVEPLGVEVAVVTGDLPAAERRARLQRIASGEPRSSSARTRCSRRRRVRAPAA